MPHIEPIVTLNGKDVSRYFVSCHSEQTANAQKDANKYDLMLANVGGHFFESGSFAPKNYEQLTAEGSGDFDFAPKHTVSVEVKVSKKGCESGSKTITIFRGEIQKTEADEQFVRIEGSCFQGGMTSRIHDEAPAAQDQIYPKEITITKVVEDLLRKFGIPEPWHIEPADDKLKDQNPYLGKSVDFDSAFNEVAAWASSIYYFDENNEFWFTGVTAKRGFSNLTGVLLRGTNASTMVGYCNHVDVYAGTLDDESGDPNERYTHWTQLAEAEAPAEEIQAYGVVTAPPVFLEDGNIEMARELAKNLLEWYRQYRDVPTIKVVNKAPGLMSKVAYAPWNGSMPRVSCDDDKLAGIGNVYGIVTRRVVDISAETGFVSTLEVTTNFQGMPRLDSEQEIWNYFSEGNDPEIQYVSKGG